jgi:hypothetical protein
MQLLAGRAVACSTGAAHMKTKRALVATGLVLGTPQCGHRRDFVFNAGFYTDVDTTGAGPRFVISASNTAVTAQVKNNSTTPSGNLTVGAFHAVLLESASEQSRRLTLDGKITQGGVQSNGSASFSGTATLNFGDGTPPLPVAWLHIVVNADGLTLSVDSATLPAALTGGCIVVQ